MLDRLTEKFSGAIAKLGGKAAISESNIEEAVRDVRLSLLEADVNYQVVRDFTEKVKREALGAKVTSGVAPAQQFVKIMHDALVELMGDGHRDLDLRGRPPAVIMMVGLQGSGKTTSAGKLALRLKEQKKKVYLVPADVYRPAAIDQLKTLARRIEVPCYNTGPKDKPVKLVKEAVKEAARAFADVVIVDTAGRLQIDKEMMAELEKMKDVLEPSEILFVADAMTGQEAVNIAKAFNEKLDVTGVVLTKMDGDARGGAALSIKAVTGKPVKFVGLGEKLEALEPFHPERMAGRILGMGDVVTLVEKAQKVIDEKEAEKAARRMSKGSFTLEDYVFAIRQMKKMGSMESVMKMMPGMGGMMSGLGEGDFARAEKEMKKTEAVIGSMTRMERRNPHLINLSRRRRIAGGSGTHLNDVSRLLKQYDQMRKVMGKMQKGGMKQMAKQLGGGPGGPGLGGLGGLGPGMGPGGLPPGFPR